MIGKVPNFGRFISKCIFEYSRYLEKLQAAMESGQTILLDNIGENIDPVLMPVIEKKTIMIEDETILIMADKEIKYHQDFRLILHTKLSNPHYGPEIQAQVNIVNFSVTIDGLEDQLLAKVVSKEHPDLERLKNDNRKQQNDFEIKLNELERSVLTYLSSATGNILLDKDLVKNLEITKSTVEEIKQKANIAHQTEMEINASRQVYSPVANTSSLLFSILKDLSLINPFYQFSLKIQITQGKVSEDELNFFLEFPSEQDVVSPVDFLSDSNWGAIKYLSDMENFKNLDLDIQESTKRWAKLCTSKSPETEPFPQRWKNITDFQRLCILRCLQPKNITSAIKILELNILKTYLRIFKAAFEEATSNIPLLFITSPGVDVFPEVESVAKTLGYSHENSNYHTVSLGQDQQIVAEKAIENASKHGHWVILQNIHLVEEWLPKLEEIITKDSSNFNEKFVLILSTEPTLPNSIHVKSSGIIEASIKITNEPPTGLKPNLDNALNTIQAEFNSTILTDELPHFRALLFSLCYFHAVMTERQRYGPEGWNECYSFGKNDLLICIKILRKYIMSKENTIPWNELKYLFGEIIYGGHITDYFDRRICKAYLEEYICSKLMAINDLLLAPGFPFPPNSDHNSYRQYIEDNLPIESPVLYKLHSNADINTRITASRHFLESFKVLILNESNLQTSNFTREQKTRQVVEEILEKLPEEINMVEVRNRMEERTPYTDVIVNEYETMNKLINLIRNSLNDLLLAYKGELTMSDEIETLEECLSHLNKVPDSWQAKSYSSTLPLIPWFTDLLRRIKVLESWTKNFTLPPCVWLGGFFNPQSILTAVEQSYARKNEIPLDNIELQLDVTNKTVDDIATTLKSTPSSGIYFHGIHLQGASWDLDTGLLVECKHKEQYELLPTVHIKPYQTDHKQEIQSAQISSYYECPLYKTSARGSSNYVWKFKLKTKERPEKWILANVAMFMQV
ncbi:Dynein beta chain, ciliary [Nymphon striatum]|nr:Dynein beta chain, ciliary [Nymphon striatum]